MNHYDQQSLATKFQILQCLREDCRFRCPAPLDIESTTSCPKCNASAAAVELPNLGCAARSAAVETPDRTLEVLLDNLRSSHNVGSILRSCDGAGIRHVHMCGITSTPRQSKVGKTALGAERAVPWSYHRNGVDFIRSQREQEYDVWSLENAASSQSIFDLSPSDLREPLIIVVGNELTGVDPEILSISDRIVCIPMIGQKTSLNAAVAFGIVAYWLQFGLSHQHVAG